MLYVVLATFAAGMATEYFLGNRWIGFFAVGVPACRKKRRRRKACQT